MNKHLLEYILSLLSKETLSKKDIENLLYYCDGSVFDFKDALLTFLYADKNVFGNVKELERGVNFAKEYGWSIANIELKTTKSINSD